MRDLIRKIRCRDVAFAFLLTAALYFIKEWYPFSHFPMYSRLDPRATLVFLTDQNDEPLGFRTQFGFAASNAKKKYNSRLDEVASEHGRRFFSASPEDKKEAAADLLDYFYDRRRKGKFEARQVTELRFYHRVLEWKGGKMHETDEFLASKPL